MFKFIERYVVNMYNISFRVVVYFDVVVYCNLGSCSEFMTFVGRIAICSFLGYDRPAANCDRG